VVGAIQRIRRVPERTVVVVGHGGKTINTLRLWEAGAPDYFDFQAFSHGDFVGAAAIQRNCAAARRHGRRCRHRLQR
jgi:hypothetical protein